MKHAGPSGFEIDEDLDGNRWRVGCGGLVRAGRLRRHGRLWTASASAARRPATTAAAAGVSTAATSLRRATSVATTARRITRRRIATTVAASSPAGRTWRIGRLRRIGRVRRLRTIRPRFIRPVVREKFGRAEIPLLHDATVVFLRLPRRLCDEPDVALEGEPFAPRIASNRRAAARERARLKPIEVLRVMACRG